MQTIILKHSVQNCKEINGEQLKKQHLHLGGITKH